MADEERTLMMADEQRTLMAHRAWLAAPRHGVMQRYFSRVLACWLVTSDD
jgi:hypothetical protein